MGVLACDREGCDNIMCDFYSPTFGYLCYSCLQELKDVNGNQTIRQFMNTPARCDSTPRYEWNNYVEAEFKSRYDDE